MTEEILKETYNKSLSLLEKIEQMEVFLKEISAIYNYQNRGIVDLKIQPILIELIGQINELKINTNIIKDNLEKTE